MIVPVGCCLDKIVKHKENEMFFRPKPKCHVGQVVCLNSRVELNSRKVLEYLHIHNRRWIRPDGAKKRQWVYDGLILQVQNEKLSVVTGMSCVAEGSLGELIS